MSAIASATADEIAQIEAAAFRRGAVNEAMMAPRDGALRLSGAGDSARATAWGPPWIDGTSARGAAGEL